MDIRLKDLNTFGDFELLSKGLKTEEEFIKKFGYSVYSRFSTLKRYGKIEKDKKFPLPKEKKNRNRLNYSVDEVNTIISNNNIESPIDLITYDRSLYNYCMRHNLLFNLNYSNPRRTNTDKINSLTDLEQFVQENNVISRTDLYKRFPGIYNKFKTQLNNIQFVGHQNLSSREILFMKELFKYGIQFTFQYTIPDSNYRFDFYLEDYNVIIEVHGRQHFNDDISKDAWKVDYSTIDRDKEKRDLVRKLNIPIFYFTYDKTYYDKYGYFDIVYTDVLSMFSAIGISTDKIDYSWENKFNEFTDYHYSREKAKSEVIEYIIDNKIENLFMLKKNSPHLYNLVDKYRLRSEIDFSTVYSLDEINNIISEMGYSNLHEIYLQRRGIYNIIQANNWVSRLKFN